MVLDPPLGAFFCHFIFFTPMRSHIQSPISELFTDRFSPFNFQSVLKYLIFNFYSAKFQFFLIYIQNFENHMKKIEKMENIHFRKQEQKFPKSAQ